LGKNGGEGTGKERIRGGRERKVALRGGKETSFVHSEGEENRPASLCGIRNQGKSAEGAPERQRCRKKKEGTRLGTYNVGTRMPNFLGRRQGLRAKKKKGSSEKERRKGPKHTREAFVMEL